MRIGLRSLLPRGLRARLALAFSLLSVILTLALLGLVERRAVGRLENQIGEGLADLAFQTSDKLERGMFERYREVELIAGRIAPGDAAQDAARMAAMLRRVQDSYAYYEWIGMVGVDGKVKAAGNGLLVGVDVSRRDWFRQGLEGGFVGDVHDAVLLAKLLPPQSEPRRFVDVAFPYADAEGRVQGVLGAHLSWNWARDVERSVVGSAARTSPVQALILNGEGRVLLGPPDLADKVLALESLRRARTARRGGHLVEAWPDGRTYVVGYQQGSGHGNYPGLGWTVLVRQDVSQAYAPVRDMRAQVLWSGAALALLFSIVGVWVARSITRPLARLAGAATRLRQGGIETIDARADDYAEVRALGRALNALVTDLEARREQLERLNGSLEQVVEARTVELRRALAGVQASEARIRAIVETAQDAFIGVDMTGRILDWNRQAELLLGWRREEAVGQILSDLILPAELRAAAGGALADFAGGARRRLDHLNQRVERVVTDRHGAEIPVEMSTGLTGEGDSAVFSIFLRDITERKRIEAMKNEFVGTVSHELRTPLTSIRASLALLADGALGALPPDVLELIEISNNNCMRLNRLVDDMLDIQKIEAGMMSFAPVLQPLLPLAREAVRTMRGMAGAAGVCLVLEGETAGEGPTAAFDYDRMTQVLVNLLSNAIRVAPGGTQVVLRVAADGEGANLAVADSGPGIAPALRERVFQPFVQIGDAGSAPKGGTGLGLAICKRIVEEHGGTITIGDAPGGGALFCVRLPARMPA
ncbi:ATP-binding protein [Massilia sp. Leaf139]|uniref:ATP-binding protein n=1 Tax=Massilia sp. Leaf139 TaxID=1736272 RepID=UPI0007018566|nr:ATP-binding protein [Massilia sp. Leaf139]KQQ97316.1 PAS domain-containing sensor histidine kinase [Massilia sp. Leaf139]